MKEIIYLVDFDGTITKRDTLDYIARTFYPEESKIWGQKLMGGEIQISDWLNIFEKRYDIPKAEYDNLIDTIQIDEYFGEFCNKNEVVIVSGGFDYNINHILKKYGIEGIKVFANELEFVGGSRIKINMNHFNDNCTMCGSCKKAILDKYRKEYKTIVFVGDGITDLCVSGFSDKVYAKRNSHLEEYLLKKKSCFTPFDNFSEIID